ncbi:MAG TPA: hypothetical protein VGC99_24050 [Candidatus Tectomicrobia bacterium]
MVAHQHGQAHPKTRLLSMVQGVGAMVSLAVPLAATPSAGNEGFCYQTTDPQRGVIYFYCPGGKTFIVKQDPQTGTRYEKHGAGPWCPLDSSL